MDTVHYVVMFSFVNRKENGLSYISKYLPDHKVAKGNSDACKMTRPIGATITNTRLITGKQILFRITINKQWAFFAVVTIKKFLHFLTLWIATPNGDVYPYAYKMSALSNVLSDVENEGFVDSLRNCQWPSFLQFHWTSNNTIRYDAIFLCVLMACLH